MNRAALSSKVCTTCGAHYAADALFCPSDGTPLSSPAAADASRASGPDTPDPYLGREISGHIEIRQLAGVGAMGRVYRAFQKGIDRDVAVKVLHRELSANAQLVQRFHREAKVASRLQHPNVVQVHLAGQLPDGAMYIVMEYLDGLSLQSALAAAGGAMPLPRAMHIALQLCDASGEAHAQGVVHRDLKPENVMLVRRGDDPDYVKVLDFGIARLNWGEQSMATAAGLIFGTARYISPEGAQGEQVGPPGDVYSIATLLYQMLAGRTPFEGDQAVALLVAQIHDAPPPLTGHARSSYVPEAIANVVMRNLAKDAAVREPDARSLGHALLEAAKASGMSPDELVVRSGLLGGRQSGAMKLPSMQRTSQLKLSPEIAERLSPAAGLTPLAAGRTAYETPAPADASPRFPDPKVAAATKKWAPPPEFAAELTAPPPRPDVAPNAAPAPKPAPSQPRGVDETLDDEAGPIIAASSPQRVRTVAIATPTPAIAAPGLTPQAGAPVVPWTAPQRAPASSDFTEDTAPRGVPAPPIARPPMPSKPQSSVDTTLSDDEAANTKRRRRSRAAVLIVFCFLLGAGLASAFAYKAGYLGVLASAGTLDEQVARASHALKDKRWDAPPGDNVKDLTTDGLARWPGDARLLDLRARATDELVKEALGKKFAGDAPGALHLIRLARELDPSDTTAEHLESELEATIGQVAPTVSTASSAPTVATATKPAMPAPRPASHGGAGSGPRAVLDFSTSKPRVGQEVHLTAKLTAKAPPEDPHFEIVGPGGASARLPAASEGALFKATFSFLEAGKYDVTFTAKVDGVTVRAGRALVAGSGGATPAPAASGDGPSPPPTPSGKWL